MSAEKLVSTFILDCFPQRPSFDHQRSKLDNENDYEHEHDGGHKAVK
jgi:hypothetical protein